MLADVNAFYLSMHAIATSGTFRRTLGAGDLIGLRCRYGAGPC